MTRFDGLEAAETRARLDPHSAILPQRRSSCDQHRRCIRCCTYCCLSMLIVLGILALIFWPRLLVICINYSQLSTRLNVAQAAAIEMVVPVSIASSNWWGIRLDFIEVSGFYSGNEHAALTRGRVDHFELKVNGNSTFNVATAPADLSPAQAATAYDYLITRCGPLVDSGTWRLDLHVRVKAYGANVAFWIRDLEMPCHPLNPVVPLHSTQEQGDECESDDEQGVGQYCTRLLCALDDLTCEEDCPNPSASSRRRLPHAPPASPPPAVALPVIG